MKQSALAKYFGRAISRVPSSSLTSTQQIWGICGVFAAGFCTHSYKKYRERRELVGNIDRLYNDYRKRKDDQTERLLKLAEMTDED